jgi:hypothetical protein
VWVASLARAREQLEQAATSSEADQLAQALRVAQRALDLLQSWVSAQLSRAQRHLALPDLVNTLRSLQVEAARQDYDPATLAALEDAIEQLGVLHHELSMLADQHNRWQQVEFSLRRIATVLERGTSTLAHLWPQVHAQAELLYQDAQWTDVLRHESDQLERALAVDNITEARERFRNYRSLVNTQLPRLLQRLNEVCQALRQIDQQIVTALRKIE